MSSSWTTPPTIKVTLQITKMKSSYKLLLSALAMLITLMLSNVITNACSAQAAKTLKNHPPLPDIFLDKIGYKGSLGDFWSSLYMTWYPLSFSSCLLAIAVSKKKKLKKSLKLMNVITLTYLSRLSMIYVTYFPSSGSEINAFVPETSNMFHLHLNKVKAGLFISTNVILTTISLLFFLQFHVGSKVGKLITTLKFVETVGLFFFMLRLKLYYTVDLIVTSAMTTVIWIAYDQFCYLYDLKYNHSSVK